MKKKGLSLLFAVIIAATPIAQAFACTGTYIGKEVSKNGNMIVARTEDIGSGHPKSYVYYEAVTSKPGEMYKDEITGFTWPMPAVSYAYQGVPDSLGYEDDGIYDEASVNEKGVIISATVSADYNDEIAKLDPLVEDGIREANIATVVMQNADSAKAGIELLAKIVDEKGSAEANTLIIADQNEAWYMEIVSGHQYAAIKLPDDVAAVMPNCLMLDYVDPSDKENVITSEKLFSLPEENGLVKEKDGKFSIRKTYSSDFDDYNLPRAIGGQHFLAPEKNFTFKETDVDLFFKPEKKVSVADVMELQKYRYEGTPFDANLEENKDIRVIGINRQAEAHVFEIRNDFPKEAPAVLWLAVGNAEHNIYIPFYSNLTKTPEAYAAKSKLYTPDQAYWAFRSLGSISELNREKYGANVRKYWTDYQNDLIIKQEMNNYEFKKLYAEDPAKAVEFANKKAEELGTDAVKKANKMYTELFTYFQSDLGRPKKEAFKPSLMQTEEAKQATK